MTCLEASQVSRFAPRHAVSPAQACWPSLAQSTANPRESRSGGDGMLPAGRALTLRARQAGVLRIVQGRVWITFNHADKDRRVRAGDHFRGAGETLQLSAGDGVVMEAWGSGPDAQASFGWEPAAAVSPMTGFSLAGWRMGVLEPLLELRLALGLATGAAARLLRGLAAGLVAAAEAVVAKVAAIL